MPAWCDQFSHRAGGSFHTAHAELRRCTLDRLEDSLGPCLAGLDELDPAAASDRERPYSVRRTLWCCLWQMLQGNAACREVVSQFQALLALAGLPAVSDNTAGFCLARHRLPEALLGAALRTSAQSAAQLVPPDTALQGRVVKVLDGTTLTLPDTPANRTAYPQLTSQRPGVGFPLLHALVIWSARGGAILEQVSGDCHHGEMRLLHQALATLAPRDIVIYDRAAGHYVGCALLRAHQADLISRVTIRKVDWRRGQRLGPGDRLVTWKKTRQKSPYLTAAEWAALPAEILVRVVRVYVVQPGFPTRTLVLVTTLLDPTAYPALQLAAAYHRRWRIELCLDDLKTVLGLDALRCKSPAMVERELLLLLIAHNLVRAVMAAAARAHAVPLDRISFTGTLVALRGFAAASAQASSHAARCRLWAALLRRLAADLVPLRPGRSEPRVVKRRPKPYPRLDRPRHLYRDLRHGSRFRAPSPLT